MERPRVLVVGGGFAGVGCARRLERRLKASEAEITLITPSDYELYLPLLPQVAAGVLTPQSVAVSLRRLLRRARIVPGLAIAIDKVAKMVIVQTIAGERVTIPYDYLVLAPGSVTRSFDIPGMAEFGRGMKTLAEAAYIRDHVLAQLDLADSVSTQQERMSRLGFVVVGGGYAGTETAACLQRVTTAALQRYPRLDPSLIKWHLVDIAPRLMPELGATLGTVAMELLRKRGMEISLGVSVAAADDESVTLTDGRVIPSRTLIWTTGVAASPLVGTLDAETLGGRLVVTSEMQVPGCEGVFALGDAAAVPDLVVGDGAICPPTAQHAQRQGKAVADNVVAAVRGNGMRAYVHKDLGLVVDLGGWEAVSRPLGINLRGLAAQAVARGYHLMALPTNVAKIRVLINWLLNATAGDDYVRMGFQTRCPARLKDFEHIDSYLSREQVEAHMAAIRPE